MKQVVSIATGLIFSCLCLPAFSADVTDCDPCAEWNRPHVPFRIHGDTYYVGTAGLSAILITSAEGHVLIDGSLAESAPLIADNIAALGFNVGDVRLILNSHAHFDHAGGISELQRASSAEVALSPWSEEVLRTGAPGIEDPQFSIALPILPVANTRVIADGETMEVGDISLTAHFTPGHTPGGTSWTWQSCEGDACVDVVYSDSLSPVSGDDYRFSDHPEVIAALESSMTMLETLSCDIFLAPHPDFAEIFEKADILAAGTAPNPFIDSDACGDFAEEMQVWLDHRLAEEAAPVPAP